MRIIDADAVIKSWPEIEVTGADLSVVVRLFKSVTNAPTIETKQIKYFDEEEKIWKIGSVIVE